MQQFEEEIHMDNFLVNEMKEIPGQLQYFNDACSAIFVTLMEVRITYLEKHQRNVGRW